MKLVFELVKLYQATKKSFIPLLLSNQSGTGTSNVHLWCVVPKFRLIMIEVFIQRNMS